MMSNKQGITTKSKIYKIENGFLLTYVVCVYDFTVSIDSLEEKTEYYKTCAEATERLSKILLRELAEILPFYKEQGVNDAR